MSQNPSPHPSSPYPSGSIRSEFANDPDMKEIVEMYIVEMPERISKLTELWRDQQLDELKRFAHQLKGASGGYGFPAVGSAAGKVESTINSLSDGSASTSLQQLRTQVEDLLGLCRRVSF
jgi:HPt (histidine-containing phosphotransfer) domain-containing protein